MKVIFNEKQLKLIVENEKKSEKTKKKDDFDRVSFYFDYYKNLTPTGFDISKKGNDITITIPKN